VDGTSAKEVILSLTLFICTLVCLSYNRAVMKFCNGLVVTKMSTKNSPVDFESDIIQFPLRKDLPRSSARLRALHLTIKMAAVCALQCNVI